MAMTLIVLAATMGNKYGGLKQLEGIGPNGETILDFSIYDAVRVGFNKIVFVISRHFEQEFKKLVSGKYEHVVEVEYGYRIGYCRSAGNGIHGIFRCRQRLGCFVWNRINSLHR